MNDRDQFIGQMHDAINRLADDLLAWILDSRLDVAGIAAVAHIKSGYLAMVKLVGQQIADEFLGNLIFHGETIQ